MDLRCTKNEATVRSTNYIQLLSDPIIVKIAIAIFISTIAMATLEPCLPIWLMKNLKPEVKPQMIQYCACVQSLELANF